MHQDKQSFLCVYCILIKRKILRQIQKYTTNTKIKCISTCQLSSNIQELLSCVNEEISQMQLFQKKGFQFIKAFYFFMLSLLLLLTVLWLRITHRPDKLRKCSIQTWCKHFQTEIIFLGLKSVNNHQRWIFMRLVRLPYLLCVLFPLPLILLSYDRKRTLSCMSS